MSEQPRRQCQVLPGNRWWTGELCRLPATTERHGEPVCTRHANTIDKGWQEYLRDINHGIATSGIFPITYPSTPKEPQQ